MGVGTYGGLTMAYYYGEPFYMVTNLDLDSINSWILGCITEVHPSLENFFNYSFKKYND